jgi:hypothetical protein
MDATPNCAQPGEAKNGNYVFIYMSNVSSFTSIDVVYVHQHISLMYISVYLASRAVSYWIGFTG